MKRVAITQSNYIPWRGYFDLIASVDEFILYDDMQYTRRDWRNRNKIKTGQGTCWLTIPVEVKGKYFQKIKDTKVSDRDWYKSHWQTLSQNYKRARYYAEIAAWLEPLYLAENQDMLSNINYTFIAAICRYLGINTTISQSSQYQLIDGKTERLVDICRQAGAGLYVSGPAAKDYLDVALFEQQGIDVGWADYDGYPVYPQQWGGFEPFVSILDLLFNCGPESLLYMKKPTDSLIKYKGKA